MDINSQDLKAVLIEAINNARMLDKNLSNKVGKAYNNGRIEELERLLIFLDKANKKGEIDMAELKAELVEKGKLADLMLAPRAGVVEPAILEIAKTLKPGEFAKIPAKTISWGHFAGRVYSMKKKGILSNEYAPKKRKDEIYLVRFESKK